MPGTYDPRRAYAPPGSPWPDAPGAYRPCLAYAAPRVPDPSLRPLIPLHDYQIYARDFVKAHPFCGLFLKMGLGKTSIALEALYEINPDHHTLIVAPKTIARCTWNNEIRKWKMPFRTKSLISDDDGKDLSKAKYEKLYAALPDMPPTVCFINRDRISGLVKYFSRNLLPWPFRTVIIDESQSFKSYSAERFKALRAVRDAGCLERVVLLTGSPAPKGLEDLWPQIYLLDGGMRLGRTITQFRSVFMDPGLIVNNHPVNWRPKPGMEKEVYDRISDLVISMDNSHLKLPPIRFNPIYAVMDPDEMEKYKAMVRDSVLEFGNGTEPVTAANAAVLSAKLSQMASGALYKSDEDKKKPDDFWFIHGKKLELCKYIIDNTDGPVIVAYRFHSDLAMLTEYFRDNQVDARVFDGTPEMELAWNRKEIPVMLIQPASCGFGLNFQQGGSTLVWYSLPWSLEQYEQTNARIYRQGQTEPVVIHQIMTEGTIDKKILKALKLKDVSQDRLLTAVRAAVRFDAAEDDDGSPEGPDGFGLPDGPACGYGDPPDGGLADAYAQAMAASGNGR